MKLEDLGDNFAMPESTAALDLAKAFIKNSKPDDPQYAEETISVILCAGQYLSDTAGPGYWDRFKPKGFLRVMDPKDYKEEGRILTTMIGFYVWLFFWSIIEKGPTLTILKGIRSIHPDDSTLTSLYEKSAALVRKLDELAIEETDEMN